MKALIALNQYKSLRIIGRNLFRVNYILRNLEISAWVTELLQIMTDTGNAAANKNSNSAHEHALSL